MNQPPSRISPKKARTTAIQPLRATATGDLTMVKSEVHPFTQRVNYALDITMFDRAE